MRRAQGPRASWQLAAAVAVSLLSGCSAQYPQGTIACTRDASDCPEGMSCRMLGDAGEGRCFLGTAPGHDSASDASTGSSELFDAATDASSAVGADASGEPAPDGSGGAGGRAGAGGAVSTGGTGDAADSGGGGAAGGPVSAAGSGGFLSPPQPCEDAARQCDPDEVGKEQGSCGACNTGSRTRTRTCDPSSCQWQAWSAWSACAADTSKCTPGKTETRTVACPHCGAKTQTRTCSSTTCTFGAWSDAGKCSWCDDCAHLEWCDTPDDVVKNRGTWCWPENGCNNDQAWGRCQEIVKEVGCAVHQPVYTGH